MWPFALLGLFPSFAAIFNRIQRDDDDDTVKPSAAKHAKNIPSDNETVLDTMAPAAPVVADDPADDAQTAPTAAPVQPTVSTPQPQPTSAVTPPDTVVAAPTTVTAPTQTPTTNAPTAPSTATTLNANSTAEVMAGRVTELDPPQGADIEAIRIIDQPASGNVVVTPDNTLAVVMTNSDYTGSLSFTYEARDADGVVTSHNVELDVIPGLQEQGWGTGANQYMLATDDEGDIIVETGEDHRKVYISNSNEALTRADIARIEGLNEAEITGDWLAANGEYGSTESTALSADVGMELWYEVTGRGVEPNSNWLMLERGYEYDDLGRLISRGTVGESELNPVHITSWGEGDRPVINSKVWLYQTSNENIVFSELHLTGGVLALEGKNVLFDDVRFTDHETNIQNIDGFTIRNSELMDIYVEDQRDGELRWDPGVNKISGIYMTGNEGVLLEGNFIDYNAWREGYNADLMGGDYQPPSMLSHNVYIQNDVFDLTFRDNITMRAASFGAQIRGGAYIEDNVFLDNNVATSFNGGIYKTDGPIGNYTLFSDNLITSGAHKDAQIIGGLTMGAYNGAYLSSLVDNIVTHLADPNNPDELADKVFTHFALKSDHTPAYDDTIIYNWAGQRGAVDDQNVDGLDTAVLDQTTIQNFAAALLGKADATIEDLAEYLRSLPESPFDDMVDADVIIKFFQEGFGIAPDLRDTATTLEFIPNALADGVRWDNRLNWSTEDLPGTQDGDSVDLNGAFVEYGGTNEINDLDFGSGGHLSVNHGRLDVTGETEAGFRGAELNIDGAGQVWLDGYGDGDQFDIHVADGRFANTGDMMGANSLEVSGGQAILATGGATYGVTSGQRLEIQGDDARVGFDGDGGRAILGFSDDATLAFTAQDGGMGSIEEFRSGAFGDNPDVDSGIDLGGASLELDVTDLAGGIDAVTLMSSDELIGLFGNTNVTGLGARDAEIVIDYETDTVRLELAAGTGQVTTSTIGAPTDVSAGQDALFAALSDGQGTYDDQVPPPEDEELFSDVA